MSQRNEGLKIVSGFFLLMVMHFLAGLTYALLFSLLNFFGNVIASYIAPLIGFAIFGIGISQLLYVVPVIFWARKQQEWGLMKGVIIGAVITALLNGGCFLIFIRAPF
jgi:hypothetical protein